MRHLMPLKYVEAVARSRSIRQAAEELAITPSALNRRILSIEEELGVAIFERTTKGVLLNTAGEIFLQHARQQISDMERVKSRIADLSGMRAGHVSIACTHETLHDWLPTQISDYARNYPNVTFAAIQRPRGKVEEMLIEHSADIGLVFEPLRLADFQVRTAVKQPIYAIMRADHVLAGRKQLRLYEFGETSVIMPRKMDGMRQILEQAATQQGLSWRIAIETNNLDARKRLAYNTNNITFALEIHGTKNLVQDGLVAVKLDEHDVANGTLFVGQLRDRALPVAAALFLEQIVRNLCSMYDS